jgi:hypothetical protein
VAQRELYGPCNMRGRRSCSPWFDWFIASVFSSRKYQDIEIFK